MKDEIEAKLDAIFKQHAATKEQVKKAVDEQTQKEEQFLASFYDVQAKVIRPALDAMGKYLEAKGYPYKIAETKDETTSDHKHQPGCPGQELRLGDDADRDVRTGVSEQPLQNPTFLLEGIDARVENQPRSFPTCLALGR